MEGMTAGQTANVIVVLQYIDANGTCVTWIWQLFSRNRRLDLISIFFILVMGCRLLDGNGLRDCGLRPVVRLLCGSIVPCSHRRTWFAWAQLLPHRVGS